MVICDKIPINWYFIVQEKFFNLQKLNSINMKKIFILLLGAFYSQNVFKLECLINFNIKFKIKEYELSKSDTSFIGVIGYAFA